jgi:hypothetical protein
MSYFNHAFNKAFVGTNGFVFDESNMPSIDVQKGYFTFVDPKTWVTPSSNLDSGTTLTQPLVLVSGSIHTVDKIGPFHGGYTETVKSKTINPKYVSKFYRVDPVSHAQMQITVGSTLNENPCNLNSGTVVNKTFVCNTTYNLRVDVKGSPALRFLSRNDYYTAAAYTGCCAEGVDGIGAPVNPLVVYTQWAYLLLNSPLMRPFLNVKITYSTDNGSTYYQLSGTDGSDSKLNLEQLRRYVNGIDSYPSGSATDFSDMRAGLIITGAYEDTRFGDCTFYPNDSIIAYLEPVKIYASEVDLNGDPCAFGGVCVSNVCLGQQGMGFGESVARDVIMTEAYMQQPFYTGMDLRIREITLGTDIWSVINRNSQYTRYYIQHNVPRFNNPTSTFDNDQYLLEIITDQNETAFQGFVNKWLDNVGSDVQLEIIAAPSACSYVNVTND